MSRSSKGAALFLAVAISLAMSACGGGTNGSQNNTQTKTTPTVTVTTTPSGSLTTVQAMTVNVTVAGSGATPTGSVQLSSGSYTSTSATLSSGAASIAVAAGSLAAGADVLTVSYTPDSSSSPAYNSASSGANITVTKVTPTVTVSPSASSINTTQALTVSVTVAGSGATPSGAVQLTSGSYTSSSTTLSSGAASVSIPAGSLALGSDTLTVSYTPDSSSSAVYLSASGTAVETVAQMITPTVTVTPTPATITTTQSTSVKVTVSGGSASPTGTVQLSSGSYSSTVTTLSSGSATINIAAGTLPLGTDTLTASYTPDTTGAGTYASASGTNTVQVITLIAPTVTVTPASTSITATQSLKVSIAASGGSSYTTPTGSVILSAGSYTSAATALSSGSASITIPASTFTQGSFTLTAAYTPDASSNSLYTTASGTTPLLVSTTISVDQSTLGAAVTDQILGMNMATWYDIKSNSTAIQKAFTTAGIKAVRWPGGSWSDIYHWSTNSNCFSSTDGAPNSDDTFANFLTNVVTPTGVDLALTADYGTDPTCTTGGLPSEAASWVTAALNAGVTVSHMTVGNENYGSWEEDLHSKPNDPATYAAAVAGASGFYSTIKAASPKTQVGVVVDADNKSNGWDATVLANAKGSYDFVELHFYPQSPDQESDANLLHNSTYDAQDLTANLKVLKNELTTYGTAGTPIYVGELGSVYTNPGKQSMSITQALFAGEVLGEMMNFGVARSTWWIGFGGCEMENASGNTANYSSSLYGWQDYGGYMVFADGYCTGAPAIGTLLPTARAYQLFSQVAVDGEHVLTPTVAGDTTDVVAYAATHNAGAATALVLFNLNETTSEPVTLSLSAQTTSTDVSMTTYSKAIYDESDGSTPDWAAPTTTDMGAQTLPLTVTLAPWSMNVLIVK